MAGECRLLYVVRACGGGMLRHLLDLLRYLDRSLFQPLVAGPPQGKLPCAIGSLGVDFIPLPLKGNWQPWQYPRLREELSGFIRRAGINLVHTHGVHAGLVGRWAAHRAGVPVIATAHNFVYSRPGPRWQKAALAWYQRRLVPITDCFIAVSQGLAQELQRVEGVPPGKIVTIYNGVDLDRLAVAFGRAGEKRLPFLADGPVVGTIARLIPEKGVDVFLRACALIVRVEPQVRFLIIGDGPSRRALEELAGRLGLGERAFFVGQVEEAASLLPFLDVYVQPSRQEGFSLAVLEAMAAGLPIVASSTGGLVEVVRPGENGYLVAPGDWEGLAREILFLLRHPGLARHLGRAGRRLVAARFGVTGMVQATQEVYRRLIEAKP